MIWVTWRQQRTEMVIAAGILALIALVLIPTGIEMANAYHHDGLSACLGSNPSGPCNDAIHFFSDRFLALNDLLAWFTLIPGVIGVLLAAPFVGELEHGTYRLAWTQSITRGRWITGKLAVTTGTALLVALILTLLMSWWHTPLVHLNGRMDKSIYDAEGIGIFGYTLFALGLALAVGVVWRRTVPAVVTAFAAYFAARMFTDFWLRQRLLTPLTATWRPGRSAPDQGPANLNHAWVISEGPSDKFGHLLAFPSGPCLTVRSQAKGAILNQTCIVPKLSDYIHTVYLPASKFWALQGIETSMFGGTALALIVFAAWWTHERVA